MFGWSRLRSNINSIMQLQDLQYAEIRNMALDVTKLSEGFAKVTTVMDKLINLVADKNNEIAGLKAQLARASGATPDEQKAVDDLAAQMAAKADTVTAAITPPAPPPPTVAPTT